MIFKISQLNDDFLQKVYDESMNELNDFYELKWKYGRPKMVIVPDRDTINGLKDTKNGQTEDWQGGWTDGAFAFMLDNEAMGANSCHPKHSPEKYRALLKHELSHVFFRHLAKTGSGPSWLWEGVAMYSSGQINFQKPVDKFENFLDCEKKDVYRESGWAVELLVEKYGKEKLFELIKSISNCPTDEDIAKRFEEIYSFALNYENFNKANIKG